MNLADDIAVMLADFGQPIASGGRTARGLVDSADEALMQSGGPSPFIGRSTVVTFRTGDLVAAEGDEITIAGVRYFIREKLQLEDGLLTRILCAKA